MIQKVRGAKQMTCFAGLLAEFAEAHEEVAVLGLEVREVKNEMCLPAQSMAKQILFKAFPSLSSQASYHYSQPSPALSV
jgi:hypothetical protein